MCNLTWSNETHVLKTKSKYFKILYVYFRCFDAYVIFDDVPYKVRSLPSINNKITTSVPN
jgi:hypothetical protein